MHRLSPALLALALLAGCRSDSPEAERPSAAPPEASIPFDIDGELTFSRDGQPITSIAVEVADTDSTRMRGLMERPEIPEDTGMLFIFPTAENQGFWMEKTPSPLDIIFFGPDSTLINVAANAVPYQRQPTYDSQGPAQFVVEVPAGFAKRHGLTPGVKIDWQIEGSAASPLATAP